MVGGVPRRVDRNADRNEPRPEGSGRDGHRFDRVPRVTHFRFGKLAAPADNPGEDEDVDARRPASQ